MRIRSVFPALLVLALLITVPALSPTFALPPTNAAVCATGAPDGDVLFEDGFDAGAPDWSLVSTTGRPNLWHWTTFAGNGSANDAMFHGGAGRLYYGTENAQGGTYNTHNRNQGEFRSPAVPLPAGGAYAIALNTKWHVEFDRHWLIDSMMLGYSVDGGPRVPLCYFGNAYAFAWNIPLGYGYYQNSPSGQAVFTGCEYALESPQNPCRASEDWLDTPTAFDLAPETALWEPRFFHVPSSAAGHTIRIGLYFQTGDAIVDDAMGWMVDDVRVLRLV